MTVDQKLDEARFFLDHIAFYEPDVSIVKYYFSAYLGAVSSIPDYILAEANQVFDLGLPIEEKWYPDKFESRAKEYDKAGKPNPLRYYKWWKHVSNNYVSKGIGKVFNDIRNMDMHKTKQKPFFNYLVLPLDAFDDEKPHKVPVEVTGSGDITSLEDIHESIELLKPHHLEQFNKIRKEKGRSLATEIKVCRRI